MEDLLQLIPLILIALFTLLRASRRKTRQQQEPEAVLENEQPGSLPPWANFLMTEDTSDESVPDFLTVEESAEPQNPLPHSPVAMDETPRASETKGHTILRPGSKEDQFSSKTTEVGTIVGIPITPQAFRQGIVLSEILGRPKSLRSSQPESEN